MKPGTTPLAKLADCKVRQSLHRMIGHWRRVTRTVCRSHLKLALTMTLSTGSAQHCLALAIQHVNADQPERAMQLCEHALATWPADAAVLQLLALLCLKANQLGRAASAVEASQELRPDHGPSLLVAGDVARARRDLPTALTFHRRAWKLLPERADAAQALGLSLQASGESVEAARVLSQAVALAPGHTDAWFALALALHDTGDLAGAEAALRRILTLAPARAEVEVNLGIVLQEARRLEEAMRAYGRAYRLREDSFGRIAHALSSAPAGRLWLDLDRLRDTLHNMPA